MSDISVIKGRPMSPAAASRLCDGAEQFGDTQVVVENRRLDGGDLTELVDDGGVELQQLSFHRL